MEIKNLTCAEIKNGFVKLSLAEDDDENIIGTIQLGDNSNLSITVYELLDLRDILNNEEVIELLKKGL